MILQYADLVKHIGDLNLRVARAECETERLKALIAEAPHSEDCLTVRLNDVACDCWKSRV